MPSPEAGRFVLSSEQAKLWASVLESLRERVKREQFETWFRRTALTSVSPGEAVVAVPNVFFREWLGRFYREAVESALRELTGEALTLRIVVDAELFPALGRAEAPASLPAPDEAAPAPPTSPAGSKPAVGAPLNADYTFENFVVGPCNRFAHAAALGVVENPGRAYNPLFVHGSCGMGKTHLLQAVCHTVQKMRPGVDIRFLSCETFINHFISALGKGDLERFRGRYRETDLLIVDDVHLLAAKERTQEEFFHTFNTLYSRQCQIVLSSDCPPKEIKQMQDRLVSRFSGGLVAPIDPPCFETRSAILQRKARARGHELPDDVIRFIAEGVRSSVRDLEGAVLKLLGYASITHRPVTIDLAREAMRDLVPAATVSVSIDEILGSVAKRFSVKVGDLQSKRRSQSIVLPRQVAMYLARKHTRYSLEEIGSLFGGKDHTTVLYALERVEERLRKDLSFRNIVDALAKEFGGRA
ncbi:MAG TPA: chromosomal replication initiator protein DnaA [Planctomycetota bacterium]|jgi:chromosomal replication initiator protein|nr:chromosomal replication initiator protein DnaA [Planctomycetota bacterium]